MMQFEEAGGFILDKLAMELPAHLTYHSVFHTQDVYQAAEQTGRAEGLNDHDLKLLLTAAWYHDAGFLQGAAAHEEASCKIAESVLPGFGYTSEDISRISGMIRATKIPQMPRNLHEQILADADLDYLGRDDFFTIGETLFREFLFFGIVHNEQEWNRLQVRFLENHHYFTGTALRLRQAKKEAHLEVIRGKLRGEG